MPHDDDLRDIADARAVNAALAQLSPLVRVLALAQSIIEDDDPRVGSAIGFLLTVLKIMARHLPPEQRTAVCWYLSEAQAELEAKWN